MGWESFSVVRFDLGPLQGQMRIAKLKSAHNSLIIGLTGLGWQTNLQEMMGWESFYVGRFDLGPFFQGQTRIAKSKLLINHFFFVLEVCNVKASYRKSYARNLLMWSDLSFGPSFKVK